MSTVKVTVTEKKVSVISPYNAAFVSAARQLGGKFDSSSKAWVFDAALEAHVREKLNAIYGTDGSPTPTLTILIDLDAAQPGGTDYQVGPVTVLKKWGRDSTPVLGDGCAVIAGALKKSGGSVKYPEITWKPGTVVRVANVPQAVAEKLIAAGEATAEVAQAAVQDDRTPEEISQVVFILPEETPRTYRLEFTEAEYSLIFTLVQDAEDDAEDIVANVQPERLALIQAIKQKLYAA